MDPEEDEEDDEAERRSLSEETRVSEVRADMSPDAEAAPAADIAAARCSEQATAMRIRAEALVRLHVVRVILYMRWLGCDIECAARARLRQGDRDRENWQICWGSLK